MLTCMFKFLVCISAVQLSMMVLTMYYGVCACACACVLSVLFLCIYLSSAIVHVNVLISVYS